VAAQFKLENKINDQQISDTNAEYLIDQAVNYINLVAGTSIANISANDLTATAGELTVVRSLSGLLFRAYLDKGSVSVAGLTVTAVVSDPHYKVFMKMFNQGLKHLRGRSFERA